MDKFKNNQGKYYTNALFKELDGFDAGVSLYTLASEDITVGDKTYIALRKEYLRIEDPTEYHFAVKYFDSWKHWKEVRESPKIKPHVDEWREELEVMLRSKGVKGVYDKALDGDYQASKWLADRGWSDKPTKKRGAPTRADVVAEARKEAKVIGVIDSHWERMNNKER